MLSGHGVGTYQENELTRNLSGNTRPQSSQLAEPLWTDPGVKSGISVRELISTHTHSHTHKRRRRMSSRTFSKNPRKRGKSHHHHYQLQQEEHHQRTLSAKTMHG